MEVALTWFVQIAFVRREIPHPTYIQMHGSWEPELSMAEVSFGPTALEQDQTGFIIYMIL